MVKSGGRSQYWLSEWRVSMARFVICRSRPVFPMAAAAISSP
jgi:hypothetical protein